MTAPHYVVSRRAAFWIGFGMLHVGALAGALGGWVALLAGVPAFALALWGDRRLGGAA